MNLPCPHCQQNLEVHPEWAGHEVTCPVCQGVLRIPAAPPIPQQHTYKVSPPRGGGFLRFVLVVLVALALGFGYACVYFHQPPQETWATLTKTAREWIAPPPPAPVATPAPIPVPPPVVVAPPPKPAPLPTTTVVVAPKPPAPPSPEEWMATRAKHTTVPLTLLADTSFPIIVNGRNAGAGNVPSGSTVNLVSVDENSGNATVAFAGYGDGTVTLPIASTDLVARVPIETKKAEDEAAAAAEAAKQREAEATAAAANAATQISVASHTNAPAATPALPQPEAVPFGAADADSASTHAFIHPGLLHTQADFDRMKTKVEAHAEPWRSGWQRLVDNPHSQLTWTPRPQEMIYRGSDGKHGQNYGLLYNDAAAAYALALRWKISGDNAYAKKGIEILNAWAPKLTGISGSSDSRLASGIYGYEMANAGEILRTSPAWNPSDFARFQDMMLKVFAPMNEDFLTRHNGANIHHYWANWDLCNMASLMAIGVVADRRDLYKEAVDYFKHGGGNGAIDNAAPFLYPDENLAQWQESGRDQGHTLMGIGLMGIICQMAWNQGDDLFGYEDNRFLKAAEYVAKYNLGYDVPYTPYDNYSVPHPYSITEISSNSRGNVRAAWELIYNHYVVMKGLHAPYIEKITSQVRPEGGGGDYGPNSGGYDLLGYGTLTYTLPKQNSDTQASAP
jgi:Alginate lyase